MAEGARLESVFAGNRNAGSNPAPSARRSASVSISFREFAEEWITAQEPGWRNPKSSAQWRSSLKSYAYPVIGDLSPPAITTGHLMTILSPIWSEKPETANRVRNRIGQILDAAKARGLRSGDNPADWRGNLKHLLPAQAKVKSVKHHEALPYAELPAFMVELRQRVGISARALEFTILTAARTGEVVGATWSEIDLRAKVWTVPAARMKGGREHRVPLSKRALEILKALPREDGNAHIFIGAHARKGLSNMSMLELLRGMREGLTVHGFRSSFRDWASEATSHPRDVVEMALSHAVGDKVEAAYRRGDLFERSGRGFQGKEFNFPYAVPSADPGPAILDETSTHSRARQLGNGTYVDSRHSPYARAPTTPRVQKLDRHSASCPFDAPAFWDTPLNTSP